MDVPFPVEPDDDTRSEILAATYIAISKHGYADLSIQRIADEFPKSKSLLYHHYDGKDEILLDFLRFLQEQFDTVTDVSDTEDPDDQLREFLDVFIPDSADHASSTEVMAGLYVQLRAQAVQDPEYAAVFQDGDERVQERLLDIINAGVEDGTFNPATDPEAVASFLRHVISGVMVHRTTGDDVTPSVRAEIEAYLDVRLRS